MAYTPSSRTGFGRAISVRPTLRILQHAQTDKHIGLALEGAHREMGDIMAKFAQESLTRRLNPERAYSRRTSRSRGIRAALRDHDQVQPRSGGWSHGFTFGQADVFARYGAEGYWRAQERGDRAKRRPIRGFLLDPAGKLTSGAGAVPIPDLLGLPLTSRGSFNRANEQIGRVKAVKKAKKGRAGSPIRNWQSFPGAGIGSGGSNIIGSSKGFWFSPRPLPAKHYLGDALERFRAINRREIYQRHMTLVGVRGVTIRGSGTGGHAAGRTLISRALS